MGFEKAKKKTLHMNKSPLHTYAHTLCLVGKHKWDDGEVQNQD